MNNLLDDYCYSDPDKDYEILDDSDDNYNYEELSDLSTTFTSTASNTINNSSEDPIYEFKFDKFALNHAKKFVQNIETEENQIDWLASDIDTDTISENDSIWI
ncbi:6039_t:CDS:1 [Ambispora gerdemannii]|uniref:6039_t:CDS:1 n=1 Tax=Ambispora gerdemannii TaxID=144530 RepID=A0A9N9EI37_9GLOM|nr:6039_t:CDS:1 [Ambispora gerdemannii]